MARVRNVAFRLAGLSLTVALAWACGSSSDDSQNHPGGGGNAGTATGSGGRSGSTGTGGASGKAGSASGGSSDAGGEPSGTGGCCSAGNAGESHGGDGGGGVDTGGTAGTSSGGTNNAGTNNAGAGGSGAGGSGAGGSGAGGSGAGGCSSVCPPVTCDGTYTITTNAEFADFVALRCTVVTGHLRIRQTNLTSLAGLVVESVGGELTVAANPMLTSLTGLERVRSVGSSLSIVQNVALTSLDPLPSWPRDSVAGTLSVFNNTALPQCQVDALDAYLAATCTNCANNGTGSCP